MISLAIRSLLTSYREKERERGKWRDIKMTHDSYTAKAVQVQVNVDYRAIRNRHFVSLSLAFLCLISLAICMFPAIDSSGFSIKKSRRGKLQKNDTYSCEPIQFRTARREYLIVCEGKMKSFPLWRYVAWRTRDQPRASRILRKFFSAAYCDIQAVISVYYECHYYTYWIHGRT